MRPRGEIRELLLSSLADLYVTQGAVTCRQLAAHTQVGYDVARDTIDNMRRAGEVKAVGKAREAGRGHHWHRLYEPTCIDDDGTPQPWGGIEALADVMHAIARSSD